MKNNVVTKSDIFGGNRPPTVETRGVHIFDMVRAVLSPAEAELATWEKVAFAGTSALTGSITKVEFLDPATQQWVQWTAKVTLPTPTGMKIRCTVRNDSPVRIGLAVDFLMANPTDWAAGKYTIIDRGPFVSRNPGDSLISEDYIFTIDQVGDYLVVFVLRGEL